MSEVEYLTCPFCGTDDFDAIGLKGHLLRGWCDPFEEIDINPAALAKERSE